MHLQNRFLFLLFVVLALLNHGCVTHKKKGETSALGRFYHNTTAKYNGYFNANEILNETFTNLENSYKDNYNKILPVFPYNAIDNVDAEKSRLDKAIEKVSTVINMHRVSRWTDDCYLLLAKSQYLKKDYETAENSFRYFLDEFNPYKNKTRMKKVTAKTKKQKEKDKEDIKKEKQKISKEKAKQRKKAQEARKKELAKKKKSGTTKSSSEPSVAIESKKAEIPPAIKKEKPANTKALTNEGNFLVHHTPAYWEGAIWASKNLIERGKYYEAEQLFRQIEADPLTPEKLQENLYASYADLYLKTNQQEKAIPFLKKALDIAHKKKARSRYAFILGQLYQKQNRIQSSNDLFAVCIKLQSSYDMVFHAKMNRLVNDGLSGAGEVEVIEGLTALLKDSKNADYTAELYYSLALINLKANKRAEGIDQLNLSVRATSGVTGQKADSYYKLAQLYLEDQNYQKSKYYFDSTLSTMAKTDERKPEVQKMISNLAEIAKYLETISLQDSLIKVSAMSTKDKRALAIRIKNANKAKIVEPTGLPRNPRLSRLDELSAQSVSESPFLSPPRDAKSGVKPSNFFAYDQRLLNRGRSEFEQSWGTRTNEDNWRRKNKTSFSSSVAETENKPQEEEDILESDLAQLLKGVPQTEAELQQAYLAIQEALYNLGVLYREKIQNYSKSNESFISLIKKYPQTERKADALYYLYLNCLDNNDSGCANSYSDQIIREFPETRYGKVLSDPEYAKSLRVKKDEIEQDYITAYSMYSASKFQEAAQVLAGLKNRVKLPHPLTAKVALLAALCTANIEGKDLYINALRDVVANFPSTPEETKAKEILRFLKGDKDAFVEVSAKDVEQAQFLLEKDKLHFVIVQLFQPEDKVSNKIKISISDYNQNYHKSENLKLISVELDVENDESLITIKNFKSSESAMAYYNGILRKPEEFIKDFNRYEIYVISQNNYREILKIKTFKEYAVFFKKNYLENK